VAGINEGDIFENKVAAGESHDSSATATSPAPPSSTGASTRPSAGTSRRRRRRCNRNGQIRIEGAEFLEEIIRGERAAAAATATCGGGIELNARPLLALAAQRDERRPNIETFVIHTILDINDHALGIVGRD